MTDFSYMSSKAAAFNRNIGAWNAGSATTLENMFDRADLFNQDLGAWNTGAVTTLKNTFSGSGAGYTAPRCTGIGYTSRTTAGSVLSVVCAGGVSRNYQLDHSATSTVTVNKATLTVTPKALSIRKGSAAPGYTFTVAGFVNGQTATTAASYFAPRCTSTYTRTSPVGSYTITCAGGSAANYSFAYRTATLTVR